MGLAYYASIRISYMLSDHMYTIPQYPVIYICACSGFFGSLVDSILGGWLQYSGKNFEIFTPFHSLQKQANIHKTAFIVYLGYNEKTQQIVSEPSIDVVRISGQNLLTNNQVNFLSCFITALVVPNQALKFYRDL